MSSKDNELIVMKEKASCLCVGLGSAIVMGTKVDKAMSLAQSNIGRSVRLIMTCSRPNCSYRSETEFKVANNGKLIILEKMNGKCAEPYNITAYDD